MTILVFGHTGQVATEIRQQGGAGVITLGRGQADLSDPASCVAVIEAYAPDAVINAAAYTAVDRAEDEEDLALLINGKAPAAMAREAAARDIPFVHISTDYVFSGQGKAPSRPSDPVAPINAYGRTKLAGEEGVRAAHGTHVILRTSWVFSAHGNNFLKTMLRLGGERTSLNVVADQIGGPTAAGDIASACLSIAGQLAAKREKTGTYHFSGAPDTSWADFARRIMKRAGLGCEIHDIATTQYPTPATRPMNSRLDNSNTQSTFSLRQPDWDAGIDAVLKQLGNRT